MTVWTKIETDDFYAVAIYNYSSADPRHLSLDVGELVHVLAEARGWYVGRSVRDVRQTVGVFPASYVRRREAIVLCDGSVSVSCGGALGWEVAAALRGWLPAWRACFLAAPDVFRSATVGMLSVLELRAQAVEGALPADTLRRVTNTARHLLDRTALALGLELAVRDDTSRSVTGLAALHAEAQARLASASPPLPPAPPAARSRLLVTLEHAALREPEPELLLALYDSGGTRALTEPYVLRPPRAAPPSRVLFVDLDGAEPAPARVALVCVVVRPGPPRRLLGVAATVLHEEDSRVTVPFLAGERESPEALVRRALGSRDARPEQWLSMSARWVGEDVPAAGRARALALPAVLAPGDARNELYARLLAGSFSRAKLSVEVAAKLVNSQGAPVAEVLAGAGAAAAGFTSLVFRHEERPRWAEAARARLDVEPPASLLLSLRHVHSSDAKDRDRRPFAVAHLPVLHADGSTVRDGEHTLNLYKVDSKRGSDPEETVRAVLRLPPCRDGAEPARHKLLLPKDTITLSTTLVSTRLTYREEVLHVLRLPAGAGEGELRAALRGVLAAPADDLVKFLADVLDKLMAVLTRAADPLPADAGAPGEAAGDELMEDEEEDAGAGAGEPVADLVFAAIVRTLGLVAEHKYNRYRALLDEYLEHGFCHATAGERLLAAAARALAGPRRRRALRTAKCLQAVARVAALSRRLGAALGADEARWLSARDALLDALTALMRRGPGALPAQGAALRYLPAAAPALGRPALVATRAVQALSALPSGRLPTQRVSCLQELLRSELCENRAARAELAPLAARTLAHLIEDNVESAGGDKAARVLGEERARPGPGPDLLELCLTTVGVLMEVLPPGERAAPARTLLPAVLRAAHDRRQPARATAALLDVLANAAPDAWAALPQPQHALDLLRTVLAAPPCPAHWAHLLHAHAAAALKALAAAARAPPGARRAWLRAVVAVPPAPASVSSLTKARLADKYGDLLTLSATLLVDTWFSWPPEERAELLPAAVSAALEPGLAPDERVRRLVLPIFFDVMQIEYFLPESEALPEGDERRLRGVHAALTDRLDALVEEGRGDEAWRAAFVSGVGALCAAHEDAGLRGAGLALVAAVGRQTDALLDARRAGRSGPATESLALTRALALYERTGPPRLVVRYVHKLAALHAAGGRPTEAGLALRRHAALLHRSRSPVPAALRVPAGAEAGLTGLAGRAARGSQARLREALELAAARYLRRGGEWELAAEVVSEAAREGGARSRAKMHGRLSALWRLAATAARAPPTYYLVRHAGRAAPPALAHAAGWVHRAPPCVPLAEFAARCRDEWPQASMLHDLRDPSDEQMEADEHLLQVVPLEPAPPASPPPHPDLRYHCTYNNVASFVYNRPVTNLDSGLEGIDDEVLSRWVERTTLDTCDTFPGVLALSRVRARRRELLCPLRVALDQLRDNADELRRLLRNKRGPLEPLTRRLLGTLDAAVQGGAERYERAFLGPAYAARHPDHDALLDDLRAALAAQGPLLERALVVHEARAPPELRALHQHLLGKYSALRTHLMQNYPQPRAGRPHSSDSSSSGTGSSEDESAPAPAPRRTLLSSLNQLARQSVASSPPAPQTPDAGTAKRRAKRRELAVSLGSSQWYTGERAAAGERDAAGSPLKELRQDLLASRPLRAEVERERRASQRLSGLLAPGALNSAAPAALTPAASAPPSCRTSYGTTDSTPSSEGDPPAAPRAPPSPPPLPQKTRHEAEAINRDVRSTEPPPTRYSYDTIYSPRGSFLYTSLQSRLRQHADAALSCVSVASTASIASTASGERAPTPPPKRKSHA